MTDHDVSHTSSSENLSLNILIRRFKEAETALHQALNGQVDAVLDPVTAIPILLRDAQKHLVESEARYRRLLSRNTVVVFELEADGTTVFVNDAVMKVLGYTALELIGHNWWDTFLLGVQYDQVDDLYTQFHSGDVTQYELSMTNRQGATIILELSSVNRRKPDGTLDRILGLALDITERRKAEIELSENQALLERLSIERMDALIQANLTLQNLANLRQRLLEIEQAALAESEHSNRMQLQFLAMISHELASPLASMTMLTTSALSEKTTFEQTQQILKLVSGESDRLYELVAQLLDLARIKSTTLTIQLAEKSLSELVASFQLQLSTMTPGHKLIIDIPEDIPNVWIDTRRIIQVIMNLVSNAVKFSPPGSTITLRAEAIHDNVQIQVANEGEGVAIEKRELIFEAFQQLEGPNQYKGVGLGLAICKGIVEAHGGNIWVADTPSGATITFTLPTASSHRDNGHTDPPK